MKVVKAGSAEDLVGIVTKDISYGLGGIENNRVRSQVCREIEGQPGGVGIVKGVE